jgi:hypothetical protein
MYPGPDENKQEHKKHTHTHTHKQTTKEKKKQQNNNRVYVRLCIDEWVITKGFKATGSIFRFCAKLK